VSAVIVDIMINIKDYTLSQALEVKMPSPLEQEFQFYLDHQDKLVAEYNGKFIVIKGQRVIGSYDDELSAIQISQESHEIGTFLVQHAISGEAATTQTYHSRVVFG